MFVKLTMSRRDFEELLLDAYVENSSNGHMARARYLQSLLDDTRSEVFSVELPPRRNDGKA